MFGGLHGTASALYAVHLPVDAQGFQSGNVLVALDQDYVVSQRFLQPLEGLLHPFQPLLVVHFMDLSTISMIEFGSPYTVTVF